LGPIDRHRLIYRWDLDKTYLRTEFDTLRDLFRRAIERPSEKRTVPGAAALLRELRATGPAGIYILSGSPEQMRRVLEAKLRLDGIHWDGFTLKPSLRNLLRANFRFLKDQVGFKLSAMVASREPLPPELDEILFGDDAETDAFIYSLYADLCAGRVDTAMLLQVLEQAASSEDDVAKLLLLIGRLPKRDHCRRIFIHLDRMSPLDRFEVYGARVCAFYNYFQPALVLCEMGALDAGAALRVGADLVIDQAFTPDSLTASFVDLARRGQVGRDTAAQLLSALRTSTGNGYASASQTLHEFGRELERLRIEPLRGEQVASGEPVALDYAGLLAHERVRVKTAKLRVLRRL
jgi:hypothetical protein